MTGSVVHLALCEVTEIHPLSLCRFTRSPIDLDPRSKYHPAQMKESERASERERTCSLSAKVTLPRGLSLKSEGQSREDYAPRRRGEGKRWWRWKGGFAFGGRQAAVRWVVIKKSLASA